MGYPGHIPGPINGEPGESQYSQGEPGENRYYFDDYVDASDWRNRTVGQLRQDSLANLRGDYDAGWDQIGRSTVEAAGAFPVGAPGEVQYEYASRRREAGYERVGRYSALEWESAYGAAVNIVYSGAEVDESYIEAVEKLVRKDRTAFGDEYDHKIGIPEKLFARHMESKCKSGSFKEKRDVIDSFIQVEIDRRALIEGRPVGEVSISKKEDRHLIPADIRRARIRRPIANNQILDRMPQFPGEQKENSSARVYNWPEAVEDLDASEAVMDQLEALLFIGDEIEAEMYWYEQSQDSELFSNLLAERDSIEKKAKRAITSLEKFHSFRLAEVRYEHRITELNAFRESAAQRLATDTGNPILAEYEKINIDWANAGLSEIEVYLASLRPKMRKSSARQTDDKQQLSSLPMEVITDEEQFQRLFKAWYVARQIDSTMAIAQKNLDGLTSVGSAEDIKRATKTFKVINILNSVISPENVVARKRATKVVEDILGPVSSATESSKSVVNLSDRKSELERQITEIDSLGFARRNSPGLRDRKRQLTKQLEDTSQKIARERRDVRFYDFGTDESLVKVSRVASPNIKKLIKTIDQLQTEKLISAL